MSAVPLTQAPFAEHHCNTLAALHMGKTPKATSTCRACFQSLSSDNLQMQYQALERR